MNNKLLLAGTLMLAFGTVSADNTQIKLGEFSKGSLQGWESKVFSGQTQYQIKQQGNLKSLSATATKSASGLGIKKRTWLKTSKTSTVSFLALLMVLR